MDRLYLTNMAFYGYHGVIPEENRLGQRYFVSLELALDVKQAGKQDDLSLTVNYADLYGFIKPIVEGPPYKLIEALAERLACEVLTRYSIINEITVKVTKPNPPFDINFDGVTVEIRRDRSDY